MITKTEADKLAKKIMKKLTVVKALEMRLIDRNETSHLNRVVAMKKMRRKRFWL